MSTDPKTKARVAVLEKRVESLLVICHALYGMATDSGASLGLGFLNSKDKDKAAEGINALLAEIQEETKEESNE